MKSSYWYILATPFLMILLGTAMNQVAIFANGGHMPVYYPGGACVADAEDIVHVCMTHATHVKFLCDWILSSRAVSSIGDELQNYGNDMITPALVVWAGLTARKVFRRE